LERREENNLVLRNPLFCAYILIPELKSTPTLTGDGKKMMHNNFEK